MADRIFITRVGMRWQLKQLAPNNRTVRRDTFMTKWGAVRNARKRSPGLEIVYKEP
jgi:hypothetical protein